MKDKLSTLALMLSLGFVLAGCEAVSTANKIASRNEKVCIDGVEYLYLQYDRGAALTAHFKPDGTLYTCEATNGN